MDLKKLCLWLLPWYRVLGMYKIGSVSLSLLIFTPMLFVMVGNRKKLKFDKSLIILYAVLMVVQFLQFLMPENVASVTRNNMFMDTIFLLTIICATNFVKLEELMKPYMFACGIFIAGLFYHVFQIYVLHMSIGPITLFPELISDDNVVSISDRMRPMSFFAEPQGFATFISIFLIIMLEEKKYLWAAIATLSILLSTSTEGLALVSIIWGVFVIFSKRSLTLKISVVVGIIGLASLYMTSTYFEVGYNKMVDTEFETNIRLVNAYNMLRNFEFNQWWLGVGVSDNSFYRTYIVSMGGGEAFKFVSSGLGVFVHYGLFVGIAFWYFLFQKIVYRYKSVFIFSICLLVIPFAQSCFFSSNFVYIFVLYYLLLKHCRGKEGKKGLPTRKPSIRLIRK